VLPFVPGPSRFCERLVSLNGLDAAGFAAWEFLPGMRFAERAAWWRGGSDRGAGHEGLDFCWYRTNDGRRLSLGAGARVPPVYAGEVVSIVKDFLGASVFVAHARHDAAGRRLHTVYGHIAPVPGLAPGSMLDAADAVGAIAAPAANSSTVPPHLHLTVALIAAAPAPAPLDWELLRDRSRVLLLDPMMIMT
jgi:hypothetical protein